MRIGELSRRSGLSRDTLRYYERQGLIRSEAEAGETNTYRDYPDDTLMTLEVIADAQAAGLTIADLTLFIAGLKAESGETFDGLAFLDRRIAEAEARRARIDRFITTLRQTRDALERAPFD